MSYIDRNVVENNISNSIFRDNCDRYWAAGLPVIPLKSYTPNGGRDGKPTGKEPVNDDWPQFQSRMPTENEKQSWKLFDGHGNIGLPLGQQSGLLAIDIDTDDPELIAAILAVLPPSPWKRIGRKGMVLVYKFEGQAISRLKYKDGDGKLQTLVEILSTGSQIVLPPSIHPNTAKPYTANAHLAEVLDKVQSLPANIGQRLRDVMTKAGLTIGTSNHGSVSSKGPPNHTRSVTEFLKDQAKQSSIVKAKPDNLASVLNGCAWMRHCEADAASLPEPEWYGMLSVSGRCEKGRELSHKLSEPYAGYSEKETDDKLHHALNDAGPVGCNKVAGEFGFEGCARCPARGITSPMNFADQPPALVRELAQYVYVIELRRYFNVTTGKLLTPEMFADSSQARVGAQAHSKAMSSRTTGKVDALDFRPGDPRLIIRNEDGSSVVNTWRQGGVQPAAGDPKPILDFFERFIVDARSREHVIQYLAHLVRYPSVKIEHAIIITGGYGTGKGTLRDILISMFGPCNVQKIEGDELTDRNNSKWVNCQTLFFEETEQGDKLEVYRRLKELITGDTYRVQDKYIPTYEGRSPRGIFMVSNESTPMLVKTNDRRYFMCDTPESPATDEEVKANGQFFAGLRRVLGRDDSAVAAFMHHLMTAVDLSSFPVKGRPPMTAAKKRAVQESRTPAAAVLADLVEAGVAPFNRDLVTAKQAMEAIEAAGWGRTLERMSMKKMADVLRSVGGFQVNMVDGDHKQVRITRDLAPRLWGIRNKAKWGDAPATDLRTEWLGGKPAAEADVVQLHTTGLDRVIAKAV